MPALQPSSSCSSTSKPLSLDVPPGLLVAADEVIE
jgi:hypothetical protein